MKKENKIIIFDCEIISAINLKTELKDIKTCAGWDDFKNMGISVICAFDYQTGRYRVFTTDNMDDFRSLVDRTDIVIGYNSLTFDNPLCRANQINVEDSKSWDLLKEILLSAGIEEPFEDNSYETFSLSACAFANLGIRKKSDGADAPIQWQRRRIGTVIDYCLNDVFLTKGLFELVRKRGYIIDPRDPSNRITIPFPHEI